jgi:D-arabinose 1-dehydrogenase-like Zn-dependent alcohol dehydrogenase
MLLQCITDSLPSSHSPKLLRIQVLTSGSPGYPAMLVAMEHNIKGSAVGNQREALEVLDMAARGLVKTHIKVEKMENLTEVFQEMSEGKMQGRVVLDLQ